jgi:hypothetical protein
LFDRIKKDIDEIYIFKYHNKIKVN